MAEFFMTSVHTAKEGAVLATELASVQKERIVELVRIMDEVWPLTEGEELVVKTVGAPTLEATEAVEDIAQGQEETEQEVETVLVSHPSSPPSTAATAPTNSKGQAKK
jgi:hypothetical protein